MSFRTLVAVTGVSQSNADLEAAVILSGEIEAHLSVLVVGVAASPPVGEYAAMVSEPWHEEREADMAKLQARTSDVRAFLADRSASADVTSKYVEATWTAELIGQRARYGDMTLIGPELAQDEPLADAAIKGALFESARPVLLLPADGQPSLRPKRIMIAWDSRMEAARAVREALPLIQAADAVVVAMVDPVTDDHRSGPEPGADLAAYLARHGAKVTVDRLPSGKRAVADVLKRHATDVSAEMIVMGAYQHSRLRERIFGGVTRSMIEAPHVPLLLAH